MKQYIGNKYGSEVRPIWYDITSAVYCQYIDIGQYRFRDCFSPLFSPFLPNSTHLTWVEWFLHDDVCHVGSKHDVKCRLCRYWHSCEKNAIEVTQMSTLGVANRLKCAQMQPNLPYPNISIILPILTIFEPWDYWQYQYELTKRHINTNMTLLCTDSNP